MLKQSLLMLSAMLALVNVARSNDAVLLAGEWRFEIAGTNEPALRPRAARHDPAARDDG